MNKFRFFTHYKYSSHFTLAEATSSMESASKTIFVLAISLFFVYNIQCAPQGRATIFTVDLSVPNTAEKFIQALLVLFGLSSAETNQTTTRTPTTVPAPPPVPLVSDWNRHSPTWKAG